MIPGGYIRRYRGRGNRGARVGGSWGDLRISLRFVFAIRLDAHGGAASRWTAEEGAWSSDGIGGLPAVRARARRRAVADSSIFSGHH